MKLRSGYVRLQRSFLFLAVLFLLNPTGAFAQASPLLVEPVDNARRVTLIRNVHPLARAEFDRGAAPPDLAMNRMLLVLKRSPDQQAALNRLLDDQQDRNSPQYRHWLTPEQFGQQFGLADGDIQKITVWLQGQGFHDIRVSKGRTVIEFSGTAAQVQDAFGTSIKQFVVNGEEHWANATDPTIPEALWAGVEGVFTLHTFYKKPQVHLTEEQFKAKAVQGARPQFTSGTGAHALGPADYYTIYNFNPLGAGFPSIAIVGRSNINLQDVTYFHYWMYDQATSPQVIVNGPDPGDLGGAEETEAVLDTTWAGAVAPSVWLSLVVSKSTATTDGVDLSELYIIDNNLADVMSESFGDCEANFTSSQATGVASLAQQAAAEGITYVVAAGDSGSAGCDDPTTETMATHGLSINMLASTPNTVAVGGTVFNENGHDSTYWKATNANPTLESAISYIPEDAWNESCASGQSGCSNPNIWAGGGGASTYFPKPSWQNGVTGIPSDNARDVPDVSLTAASHDPYLLCLRGSCIPNGQGEISFAGVSGTSASTAAFAGIMALVGNKIMVRLGQPNYVLYRWAATENLSQCNASSATLPASTCIFNDVTVGNNAVPGETNYGTSSATYQSGKGYDLATGLGSVNVTNLINQWNTVTFSPTTTTFSISPSTAVHGSPLNVSGNVTPNSGTGVPSGVVWVQGGSSHGNLVGDSTVDIFALDAQGAYTGVTHLLPGGTYGVNAHYAGDGIYAGSDSSPVVQVTIQPERTTITFSVLTAGSGGTLVPFSSRPYGTPVYYQAHVSGQSGYGKPGNWVNFWDTNGASQGSNWLDGNGNALTPALTQIQAGAHSITAGYYGDNSFSSSVDLTPINFTITVPLVFSPPSLFFGTQLLATSSTMGTVTLTNSSAIALTIGSIAVVGANSSDFGINHNCPISPNTLAAGTGCALQATFTPQASGPRKSSVSISHNLGTQTVFLTGVGAAISTAPSSLTFSSRQVGVASASMPVTIANVGSSTVSLYQIAFIGPDAGDLSQSNTGTCGSSLGAGANCTVNVVFTPGATGNRNASLMISSNGGGSPQAVPVSGIGTSGTVVTLSASSLVFAEQAVGTVSSAQQVVLSNRGTLPLAIRMMSVVEAASSEFIQTNTCGSSLAAGTSCTIEVRFAPRAAGARTAVIGVLGNGHSAGLTLHLEGTGIGRVPRSLSGERSDEE